MSRESTVVGRQWGMLLASLLVATPVWAVDFSACDALFTSGKTTHCSNDTDCTIITGACGEWMATNVTYRDKVAVCQAARGMVVDCIELKPTPKPKASCINNTCTIKTP